MHLSNKTESVYITPHHIDQTALADVTPPDKGALAPIGLRAARQTDRSGDEYRPSDQGVAQCLERSIVVIRGEGDHRV